MPTLFQACGQRSTQFLMRSHKCILPRFQAEGLGINRGLAVCINDGFASVTTVFIDSFAKSEECLLGENHLGNSDVRTQRRQIYSHQGVEQRIKYWFFERKCKRQATTGISLIFICEPIYLGFARFQNRKNASDLLSMSLPFLGLGLLACRVCLPFSDQVSSKYGDDRTSSAEPGRIVAHFVFRDVFCYFQNLDEYRTKTRSNDKHQQRTFQARKSFFHDTPSFFGAIVA
ncbi:hypothetical protein PMI40_02235 [Herbaspirillum sp. YR522]|nr:hypothetical protein PMI40_02235 [Herbaspirillum sp. YR522]